MASFRSGIDKNDKEFLFELGKGTDITTTFDDWNAKPRAGKTIRKVQEDHSNVETRTRGTIKVTTQTDISESTSAGLSATTNIGAGPTIPASGAARAGVSRSHTINLVKSENVVIIRKLVFKDDTPSFPTELENDMYEWLIESLSTSVKIEDGGNDCVKKLNDFIDQLQPGNGELDDITDAIIDYISTNLKATHYVSSISLGARRQEIREKDESTTEADGGGDMKVLNAAGAGVTVHRKSERGTGTCRTIEFGDYNRIEQDGGEAENQLAIVGVGITRISELVRNSRVKSILDEVIDKYQEKKKERAEGVKSGLSDPVRIYCNDGVSKVYWCVDDGAHIIKGTPDKKKSSKFYLEDKGKGIIYIFCYEGEEIRSNRRRLAVIGADLPNTKIIVAKTKENYNKKRCNLEFEMNERDPNPKDKDKKMTVAKWLNEKDSVRLCVRSRKLLPLKRLWPKFYIKMNEVQSTTEYDISFPSKENGDFDPDDDLLLFLCESEMEGPHGELLGTGQNASSHGSRKVVGGSTASYIADREPPSDLESRIQSTSDSSPAATEISNYPRFSMLVSEDYIFDFDIEED